jgi:hypothetical protein
MRSLSHLPFVTLLLAGPLVAAEPKSQPVAAVVETTLATGGDNIRQFAFDGDPNTCFASEKNPGKDDHFTLVFDAPVLVKSIAVVTGKPDGKDILTHGFLEGTEDGKVFKELSVFTGKLPDGTVGATPVGRLRAVRIRPGAIDHPLIIREFTIESDPPVAVFKYPVEVVAGSDDPEMLPWVQKAAGICERQYGMICEELRSDGFKPRNRFTMTLRGDYNGVAATGRGRVTGSVKYFKDHKSDFGAMVHETVHVVQSYRGRDNPGWLVEGVADYIRFFKYEPGKIGRVNPDRWRYNGAYRQTAAFLNYVAEKYDKDIVRKLNAAMREGEYKDELWKLSTRKSVEELGAEWKATLKR